MKLVYNLVLYKFFTIRIYSVVVNLIKSSFYLFHITVYKSKIFFGRQLIISYEGRCFLIQADMHDPSVPCKVISQAIEQLGGVDAIVFTAGLGENSAFMREKICNGLEFLGTRIDTAKNNVRGAETEISVDGAKVKIFLIPTNEELVIARDTESICASLVTKN